MVVLNFYHEIDQINAEFTDKRRKTDESAADELINETLTKILRQNIKILSKLDIIISNQKALESRVSKVEESFNKNNNNNQGDEEYIKKIIKENYEDFIKRFKRYDKWIIFYEKNIASPLLAKYRSVWGSLASKVKDIMYVIFKEFNLLTIPANLDPETYMTRILQLLRGKNQLSNIQIAYAISICEILLNPKNLHIQVTQSVIKPILMKNLKKITSKDNYSYSNNDEIEVFQEAEEIHKGVDKVEEVVDEVEEVADEAEEVLQEEEENEIREKEDEEKGGRIYINSTDEEIKELKNEMIKKII
ncbi:hypothetical protein RhiirA4_482869 [Rhizophagus irregularis]|uniref:Uncharacterized protein n=1 Tax=Rhizophagus irregularis TaxID=588596 RepID=A0A2I1HLN3_9GLOM|nr:hypothetical protein RhiirA4_482869 [Rhizophagus irregularis]